MNQGYKSLIILIFFLLIGFICSIALKHEFDKPIEELITEKNLTYAYYDIENNNITYKDSGIAIYHYNQKVYK